MKRWTQYIESTFSRSLTLEEERSLAIVVHKFRCGEFFLDNEKIKTEHWK